MDPNSRGMRLLKLAAEKNKNIKQKIANPNDSDIGLDESLLDISVSDILAEANDENVERILIKNDSIFENDSAQIYQEVLPNKISDEAHHDKLDTRIEEEIYREQICYEIVDLDNIDLELQNDHNLESNAENIHRNDRTDSENRNTEGIELQNIYEETGTQRKRKSEKKMWKKEVNKSKRAKGEKYVGRKYTSNKEFILEEKHEKVLGPSCHCKTAFTQCQKLSEAERNSIFTYVWSMSWSEKKIFVESMVSKREVSKRSSVEISRRNTTQEYYIKNTQGTAMRVCKQMFLNTTGLTDYFVRTYAKSNVDPMDSVEVNRESLVDGSSIRNCNLKQTVKTFLSTLPVLPSHYSRKDTKKLYLEPLFKCYSDVYRTFQIYCRDKSLKCASRQVFMEEFHDSNFDIFHPRKDQCNTCVSFETNNLSKEEYDNHIKRKDLARNEMQHDNEFAAKNEKTVKMVTIDLQCVLLCPSLKASALYYRTKLCIHNFTIFDCVSRRTMCYLWNESEGGLSAQEFASCVYDYLTCDTSFEKYIIFSDGCTYQNRNISLAKALNLFATRYNKIVEQKFLVSGHTQMKVDSVHSCIERALHNQTIYCPADYIRLISGARKKQEPYNVKYIEHSFFKDFSKTSSISTIRPGKLAGDPKVTDIRALLYNVDGISFKLNFNDEWSPIPIKRGETSQIQNEPKSLLSTRRNISAVKYNHLQQLKEFIPSDYHNFYDTLPHD